MDNSLTDFEVKGAYYWFFGVGILMSLFAYGLTRVDNGLTNSKREIILNSTLKEIRSAQHSLSTGKIDDRQLVTESVGKASVDRAAH